MADADAWHEVRWQGGWPPGGVTPYNYKGRQVGWQFQIKSKKLPRDVTRSKFFSFLNFGEDAEAEAKVYRHQFAEENGLEIKNQYRCREGPNDGLPYIEFHVRDSKGKDRYPKCDVEDLPLLEEHTWHILKCGNNIYVATKVRIGGKKTTKLFHSFKRPDWPMVDHINRNGLDNRSKHLRDGSGGVNQENCRPRKDNKSGVNGGYYHNCSLAWFGYITINKKKEFSPPYHGPEDKTHPSFLEACEWRRVKAAQVGNINGQMPEDSDSDEETMADYLASLGI